MERRKWEGRAQWIAVAVATAAATLGASPVAAYAGERQAMEVPGPWYWVGFVAVVAVLCILAIPRILKWQRRTMRIFYRIELQNQGNVTSRYHLRAIDPTETLQFRFLFNGLTLQEQFEAATPYYGADYSVPGAGGMAPMSGAAPGMPQVAMPQVAVPKEMPKVAVPAGAAPAQAQAPAASSGGNAIEGGAGQASESSNAVSDLLNTIGILLPGGLGRPFIALAGKLRWSGFLAKRFGQIPQQLGRVFGVFKKKPPKMPAAPKMPAGVQVALPAGAPAGVPMAAPAGHTVAPAASRAAAPGGVMQAWSLTPPLTPHKHLVIDLMIEPKMAFYNTQYCPFNVISRCAEYPNAPLVTDEASLQIKGLSFGQRFGPFLVLGGLIICLLLLFLAIF